MEDNERREDSSPEHAPCIDEAMGLPSPINHARPRPMHIPRQESGSYPHFKACQTTTLRTAVNRLGKELGDKSGILHMEFLKEKLTVYFDSQSKLTQQELQDLQKATHFDKKELQQWYKGGQKSNRLRMCVLLTGLRYRLPQGLSIWHSHQRRVPEDIQAVLSLWRSLIFCRLCIQRL